jgi:hypothetical protein
MNGKASISAKRDTRPLRLHKDPRKRIPPPLTFDLDALPDNPRLSQRQTAAVPQLKPWEGPFSDPARRLPQHPGVAVE